MAKALKILFVHPGESSFVGEDIRILSRFGQIERFLFKPAKTFGTLAANAIKQFIWLSKHIRSADIIYGWFADYHTFLPVLFSKIFKKPSLIVLGGYDCNKFEYLNYGVFCSKWRAPLARFVLKNSTLLLPVDETLISTNTIAINWEGAHPNGVMQHVANFKTNWKAVATGYDKQSWKMGAVNRAKTVTTVALCEHHKTALVKGWDLVIETSKLLPEFKFQIVGASPEMEKLLREKYNPGNNVDFIPPQKRADLEVLYQKNSVYLQLSRTEGLPNVLCEAMLCGCVPVGSAVFGIPHGIGNTGFVALKPKPSEIAHLINQAHENAGQLRAKARQRIEEHFSLEKRENELKEAFHNLGAII